MRADEAAECAVGGASRGAGAPGLHARLVERAAQRLLRAPGVPRRQRAGAGRHHAPLPAPGGRALRRGAAHEDPRPGGVRPLLPGGRRAPRGARAAARGGARGGAGERGGARRDRAGAGLGGRGGDRGVLPAVSATSAPRRRWWRRFDPEIEQALENPVDFKSTLQELLAQRGEAVTYDGHRRARPSARAHFRGGRNRRRALRWAAARGAARSTPSRRPRARQWSGCRRDEQAGRRWAGRSECWHRATRTPIQRRHAGSGHASEVAHAEGLQVLPRPHAPGLRPRRHRRRGAQRLGQVERHRRRAVGDGRAVSARGSRTVDAGRDLRRWARRAGAQLRGGRDRARQLRRHRRAAAQRDLDPAPPAPLRRGRVPPQRRSLPAWWT